MKGGSLQTVARPVYYDRNPIPKVFTGPIGGLGPHALTQRFSYTVPAGKKAYHEYAFAQLSRSGVATTVGVADVQCAYNPVSGGGAFVELLQLATNGLNDSNRGVLSALGLMVAGDNVTGSDEDASTGGSVVFRYSHKITEFDL